MKMYYRVVPRRIDSQSINFGTKITIDSSKKNKTKNTIVALARRGHTAGATTLLCTLLCVRRSTVKWRSVLRRDGGSITHQKKNARERPNAPLRRLLSPPLRRPLEMASPVHFWLTACALASVRPPLRSRKMLLSGEGS